MESSTTNCSKPTGQTHFPCLHFVVSPRHSSSNRQSSPGAFSVTYLFLATYAFAISQLLLFAFLITKEREKTSSSRHNLFYDLSSAKTGKWHQIWADISNGKMLLPLHGVLRAMQSERTQMEIKLRNNMITLCTGCEEFCFLSYQFLTNSPTHSDAIEILFLTSVCRK